MKNIDWNNLGFDYSRTNAIFLAHHKDGKWSEGELVDDNMISISVASTALHYGQQCFEGMKAYRAEDGRILLFRPEENAKRFQASARRILMEEVPVDLFLKGVKEVVLANSEYIPPYGTGGTLYIRPFLIGVGHRVGVAPAPEYIFCVFVMPVGAYFKGGLAPVNFITTDFDRAAPQGTGQAKVGGNYAASLLANKEAKDQGYADCIYLDPLTHTKIEEVGAANFFGITAEGEFVTPKSPSILGSITKYSLLQIAEDIGLKAIEDDVYIDKLDRFVEAGACGTAAVISPIGAISHKGEKHVFYSEEEVGPITKKLYDTLTGIQFGDLEDKHGWTLEIGK
ncbi:MAG: branched-chain amino acid aminotransferase [Tissierellia bacterium]|nr:branched-chain amino acid aminotransferase [Tissierellia bacterium]